MTALHELIVFLWYRLYVICAQVYPIKKDLDLNKTS